jgi:hypothetical protein
VLCTPLPPDTCREIEHVELYLQHGQDLQAGREDPPGTMRFECEVKVRRNPRTGQPSLTGPAAHGPTDGRFLYLVWQGWVAGTPSRFRRMKITLTPITWEQIDTASSTETAVLEATVSGVGRDGTPAAASVPLLGNGWEVQPG